jgi:hypothetical protein
MVTSEQVQKYLREAETKISAEWVRQQADEKAARDDLRQCYPRAVFIGVDPAKPGTDMTHIVTGPAASDMTMYPLKPKAAPAVAIEQKPDTDRLWDLVVLAARASRYGE